MWELAIVVTLMVCNAFLALAEMSIVSSRKARLEAMASKGTRGARSALALMAKQDDFLSAVQVGITLVGIVSGVFGGATLAAELSIPLSHLPLVGEHAGALAYGAIIAVLTYLSVVIGELVPKQLALASPERFACAVAPAIALVVVAAMPVVRLLSSSSAVVLRLLGRRPNQSTPITEEDVTSIMAEASRTGAIPRAEHEIADRALRLAGRPVTSIMTPRTEVVWISIDEPLKELTEKLLSSGYSHFPVCQGKVDNVLGEILHKHAVRHLAVTGFSTSAPERRRQLEHLVRTVASIPANCTVADVVEVMKQEKTHFAVVVDEYGGMEGVLSSHDVLEALVGYVAGGKNEEDAIVVRQDGSLLVSGWVPLDEVFRQHDVTAGAADGMMSVASFLLSTLRRIPATGETTEAFGLRFEVVDKDGLRIDRVLIRRLARGPGDDALPGAGPSPGDREQAAER